MKPLRYTYLAKGKYWRFRHASVGDFALRGKPGSASFMQAYGELLAKIGGEPTRRPKPEPKPKRAPDERQTYLYFIRSEAGTIKIGITSDIKKRMRNLQVSHPTKLELIARFPGTRKMERVIHDELKAHRVGGEWFNPAPELFAIVSDLRQASKS